LEWKESKILRFNNGVRERERGIGIEQMEWLTLPTEGGRRAIYSPRVKLAVWRV
jgi:hypothetical protein